MQRAAVQLSVSRSPDSIIATIETPQTPTGTITLRKQTLISLVEKNKAKLQAHKHVKKKYASHIDVCTPRLKFALCANCVSLASAARSPLWQMLQNV